MQFADLDLNKLYTYADYYKWQFDERVKLIWANTYETICEETRMGKLNAFDVLVESIKYKVALCSMSRLAHA